jgi:hypothetical protein
VPEFPCEITTSGHTPSAGGASSATSSE